MKIEKYIKDDVISHIKVSPFSSQAKIDYFLDFIENNPDSFYGRNQPGHITSSVLIVDETHQNVLLTHHKKFDKWLQLGGHWLDGDFQETIFLGGMREVFEEAYGNKKVPYIALMNAPLDLDVHQAGKDVHYDICFLVEIDKNIPISISNESKDLKWVSMEQALQIQDKNELRLGRMIENAKHVLSFGNNSSKRKGLKM